MDVLTSDFTSCDSEFFVLIGLGIVVAVVVVFGLCGVLVRGGVKYNFLGICAFVSHLASDNKAEHVGF